MSDKNDMIVIHPQKGIKMEITQEMYRLKNLKMMETSNGVAWTANIIRNTKKIGWVEDDSRGVVLRYGFDSKEIAIEFEAWSKIFGFQEWIEIDIASAGLYKLSDIYAVEVEGCTV